VISGITHHRPSTIIMKSNFPATASVTLLMLVGVQLEASESFKLETDVYVFRNSDFHAIKIPGAAGTGETHGVVVRSPATAQFDQETLTLAGSHFAWSGGHNPPDRFSLLATPTVPLTPGKPVILLSTVPVQYLEKAADGTLQVREIAGDSPEAPHWRLSFTMRPAREASEDLHLACDLDIATVAARENVAGVTLAVGKPVLARCQEKLDPMVRAEEWSALVLQGPNGSDYSMLLLFKIARGNAPDPVVGAQPLGRLMPAAELNIFATFYYRHPRPELVAGAIEAFGPSGFAQDRSQVFVGFFAEVFAANPDRRAEWRKLIDRQDPPGRGWLHSALYMNPARAILASTDHSVRLNDLCWGAFFASGNPAYLRRLVDQLRLIDGYSEQNQTPYWVGATAMWSLARNAPGHPLVRVTLEAIRKETDPRTRDLIDDLLRKDPSSIKREISDLRPKGSLDAGASWGTSADQGPMPGH